MPDKNNQLEFQLEQDIATFLIAKLEAYELTLDRASQIAQFILAHLPDNLTDEQIRQILPALDDEFSELGEIVYKYMLAYEEQYKNKAVENIGELIKHRHFEEASNLATNYFNKKYERN